MQDTHITADALCAVLALLVRAPERPKLNVNCARNNLGPIGGEKLAQAKPAEREQRIGYVDLYRTAFSFCRVNRVGLETLLQRIGLVGRREKNAVRSCECVVLDFARSLESF